MFRLNTRLNGNLRLDANCLNNRAMVTGYKRVYNDCDGADDVKEKERGNTELVHQRSRGAPEIFGGQPDFRLRYSQDAMRRRLRLGQTRKGLGVQREPTRQM
jgi:hypothetical protein